ncbi:MAG: hypothetical protein HY287_03045 [Planctomycetes bacterium]|nr:hypothetical protein [Planctomycetota bacterium]
MLEVIILTSIVILRPQKAVEESQIEMLRVAQHDSRTLRFVLVQPHYALNMDTSASGAIMLPRDQSSRKITLVIFWVYGLTRAEPHQTTVYPIRCVTLLDNSARINSFVTKFTGNDLGETNEL